MHRLAAGEKVKINQKEMKQLNKKNYDQLPENKKRRDEEKKKIEAIERNTKINQYKKELDERRKAQLKKKQKANMLHVDDEMSLPRVNEEICTERMTEKQIERMKKSVMQEYNILGDPKSARK